MNLNRRQFVRLLASGLAARAMACGKSRRVRPNIILCMADDQGWGDMGYNGHPRLKTPNFDSMAAEALRFDRFYAAAPVCSPTRGSVMTGRHPNRFGCFKWGYTLRPQEITLSEALKSAGYVTGHFGKWHLGSVRQGCPVNPGASGFDRWLSAPNFFDNDPILSREGRAEPIEGESSMVTVNAALEFIRGQTGNSSPFFAVVWFGSPHLPHRAAGDQKALYSDEPDPLANFYGEISGMDRAFGRLRQELRTLGIEKETLLWYCSDNGGLPNVGSTGGRGHKGQIYEGGLRVPALLEWPGVISKPRSVSLPCNTSDIYPTLLEIAGMSVPGQPPLDGISLVPAIRGQMSSRPAPMGFWDFPVHGIRTPSAEFMSELLAAQKAGDPVGDRSRLRLEAGDLSRHYPEDEFPGHAAWLDWPWKLHRIEKEPGAVIWELYHLERDPLERDNLISSEPEQARLLKTGLGKWQQSVISSLNGEDYQS